MRECVCVCVYTCTLIVDFNKKTRIVSYSILIRYGLGSIDTSFRVFVPMSYRCCTCRVML